MDRDSVMGHMAAGHKMAWATFGGRSHNKQSASDQVRRAYGTGFAGSVCILVSS